MAERTGLSEPISSIPVEQFFQRFNVENQKVLDVLSCFPIFCYLLGNVTQKPQGWDSRPDGIIRAIYFQTEGSAMFGLKNPEDAMRWKGIFNHIVGSTRNVYFIANLIAGATEEQKQKLAQLGYDQSSIDSLDPNLLLNFMFISHAGRRKTDEHRWYRIHEPPVDDPNDKDPNNHSYLYTMELLKKAGAPDSLLELMRVEDHRYEVAAVQNGIIPNVVDSILTYCDWTFNQTPVTLKERFNDPVRGLRATKRQPPEVLDILEKAGTNFENALKAVFGEDIYDQMARVDPFPGERTIREAYAASAGLTLTTIYPDFAAKYAV